MGTAQVKPDKLNWSVRKVKRQPDIGDWDNNVAQLVGLTILGKIYLWGVDPDSSTLYHATYTVYQNGTQQFSDIELAIDGRKVGTFPTTWVGCTFKVAKTAWDQLPAMKPGYFYHLLSQRKPNN